MLHLVLLLLLLPAALGCTYTCNINEDQRYLAKLNISDSCDGGTFPSLSEVGNNLTALAEQFHVEPIKASQQMCLLNKNSLYPELSFLLSTCVNILAPSASDCSYERELTALGLDDDGEERISICAPQQPCREFNKYLANGTLLHLASSCGVKEELYTLLSSPDFILSAAEGFDLQRSEEGLGLNCHCAANGEDKSIRGAVYGPILYANAKLIYFLGGQELFGRMPACRKACNDKGCDPLMDL